MIVNMGKRDTQGFQLVCDSHRDEKKLFFPNPYDRKISVGYIFDQISSSAPSKGAKNIDEFI